MNLVYVVVGVIGLFILLQLSVKLRGWFRKGKPAPKVNGKLGREIQKGSKVVAYFYSPTCRACHVQESYFPKVEEKFKNIVKINAGKEPDVARAFGVMGTPTTVIIEKGKIKNYFVGAVAAGKLLKSLN